MPRRVSEAASSDTVALVVVVLLADVKAADVASFIMTGGVSEMCSTEP